MGPGRLFSVWNTDDLDGTSGPEVIYGGADPNAESIATILGRPEPWHEAADGRLEIVNRIKLWRFLTGDESYDVHYWLTRVENRPENRLASDLQKAG